jgi:putative transposase
LYAQRIGSVVASPSTWSRLVRECGWRRPRRRVYPAKPKVGIRANAPNELWHIDVTIIKLLDGTRAYLHAALLHGAAMIKVVPSIDEDQAIG